MPATNTYLDGQRTLIALFYVATYAPEILYAQWEHLIEPIAIRGDIAVPNRRSVSYSTGSGTPWVNFDIRKLKPLEAFLVQDLFWEENQANAAVKRMQTGSLCLKFVIFREMNETKKTSFQNRNSLQRADQLAHLSRPSHQMNWHKCARLKVFLSAMRPPYKK